MSINTDARERQQDCDHTVRSALQRFEENDRIYFKVRELVEITGHHRTRIANTLLDMEENGEIGRWSNPKSRATTWMIEDIEAEA